MTIEELCKILYDEWPAFENHPEELKPHVTKSDLRWHKGKPAIWIDDCLITEVETDKYFIEDYHEEFNPFFANTEQTIEFFKGYIYAVGLTQFVPEKNPKSFYSKGVYINGKCYIQDMETKLKKLPEDVQNFYK